MRRDGQRSFGSPDASRSAIARSASAKDSGARAHLALEPLQPDDRCLVIRAAAARKAHTTPFRACR